EAVPPEARTRILCETLEGTDATNDFGFLAPEGSSDGIARRALRELGPAANPPLLPLLGDTTEAYPSGSEIATVARRFHYRRCDFAYRYISFAIGRNPEFRADAPRRDALIRQLKVDLDG